jgi:cell division protein FtsI (penicillin-binding protein 3)
MEENSVTFQRRSAKLLILYGLLLLLVFAFLWSALRTIHSDRHLPFQMATIHDRALRGKITSQDNYTLSLPHKIYQAIVYAPGIDPEKRTLFIRLFSIYSGISEQEIERAFLTKNGQPRHGYVTLTKSIDAGSAIHLKSLAYKLRRLRVFRPVKNRHGIEIVHGLDIIESGEQREFPFHDVLEPVLGYIRDHDDGKYIEVRGGKGLERHYERYLASKQNGWIRGERDIAGTILRNGTSQRAARIDGMDLHLNIPLSLQRRAEFALDAMQEETGAQEILAAIMESHTGRLLALASTRRYDPAHIRQKDLPSLDLSFVEYPHEPGSVIKPITLAIVLEHKKVTPGSWFNVNNGKLKLSKKFTISDDESFDSLTATDIIVHSSNIGISKIAWRISGKQQHEGLKQFGFAQPTGIDLSRELHGQILSAKKLARKVNSAPQAYGYGMTATFAQLLKAYSAFNNNGVAVTPQILDYVEDANGTRYAHTPKYGDRHVVSAETAHKIHTILKIVVARGTGTKAQYPGLEIGGKTGTAHISHGVLGYTQEYHSSFYGFANDKKGHAYTIGVLVIKASKPNKYFASQSAVPAFRTLVDILVDQGFLQPDLDTIEQQKRLTRERQRKAQAAQKQRERTRKIKARLKAQRKEILKTLKKHSLRRKKIQTHRSRLPERTPTPAIVPPASSPMQYPTPHDLFPDMF